MLNDMHDIYKNIEEYNPNKKRQILIVFDDMIADMLSNDIRLNSTHCFIMKISNKRELLLHLIIHQIIDSQDFTNLYKKCTKKPYSFLISDTILASDNHSRFKNNLLEI